MSKHISATVHVKAEWKITRLRVPLEKLVLTMEPKAVHLMSNVVHLSVFNSHINGLLKCFVNCWEVDSI